MLLLTENASMMIRDLLDHPDLPAGSGIRIAQETEDATDLAVTPAPEPQPGDQVVEDGDARVFLGSRAATLLEDKVLDAAMDTAGQLQFRIADQS